MDHKITYKAVKIKDLLLMLFVFFILLSATLYICKLYNIYKPTFFLIVNTIITIVALKLKEIRVELQFMDSTLLISEYRFNGIHPTQNNKIPYTEIKNYNIFSMQLFKKPVGNILRIKSATTYNYILSQTSSTSQKFNQHEWETLQTKLFKKLNGKKKTVLEDRLIAFFLTTFPILCLLVAGVIIASLFIWLLIS